MKRVGSNVYPERTQLLQGVLLVCCDEPAQYDDKRRVGSLFPAIFGTISTRSYKGGAQNVGFGS